MSNPNSFRRVVEDVLKERRRQDARPDGGIRRAVERGDELLALGILTEEVGEVAKDVLDGGTKASLRAELVQVAAVAVAWVQALDE